MHLIQDEEEDIIPPPDDRKVSEWITVLAALDFEYRLSRQGPGWAIHVPLRDAAAARAELDAYEEDERARPPAEPARADKEGTAPASWSPWWVGGFVIAMYVWLGPYDAEHLLLRAAAADSTAILRGEWWRLVTALTVHSGPDHLAGNVLCLLLVGRAVCQSFGGGLGWALTLAAGVAGNALACRFYGPNHVSVGASTACFGLLGILSADQAIRNFRRFGEARSIWSRTWVPLGAGVALLTLLGTGPQSDLAAHAFGFAAGLTLCVPFGLCGTAWLPAWGQRVLQMASLVAVMTAWRAVLEAAL